MQVLEKCNKLNIDALTEIVGANRFDGILENEQRTEAELRATGNVWADHILENANAYIMTFIYIFVTVVSGFPLFQAVSYGAGLDSSSGWTYLCKCSLLDAHCSFGYGVTCFTMAHRGDSPSYCYRRQSERWMRPSIFGFHRSM